MFLDYKYDKQKKAIFIYLDKRRYKSDIYRTQEMYYAVQKVLH